MCTCFLLRTRNNVGDAVETLTKGHRQPLASTPTVPGPHHRDTVCLATAPAVRREVSGPHSFLDDQRTPPKWKPFCKYKYILEAREGDVKRSAMDDDDKP